MSKSHTELSAPIRMSIRERLYRNLKTAILGGELKPGGPIFEGDVGRRFKASRTPAREALTLLVEEGLLEVVPRGGYFVTRITLRDVLECYHLRAVLEPEAAALAARRETEPLVRALERIMARHANVPMVRLNRRFHLLIARASGNDRLAKVVEKLLDDVQRVVMLDPYVTNPQHDKHEHWAIVEGLKRRDPEAARSAMRLHLDNSERRILRRFELHESQETKIDGANNRVGTTREGVR